MQNNGTFQVKVAQFVQTRFVVVVNAYSRNAGQLHSEFHLPVSASCADAEEMSNQVTSGAGIVSDKQEALQKV